MRRLALIALLLVSLTPAASHAAPAAQASTIILFATATSVKPGEDAYTYVVGYNGPAPAVAVIRLPLELEVGPIYGTFDNCGEQIFGPGSSEHRVILCESTGPGPESAAIEVRVLPQPCGNGKLLVATGEATGPVTSFPSLVRLELEACPTPPPPPQRLWLPWILQEADAREVLQE